MSEVEPKQAYGAPSLHSEDDAATNALPDVRLVRGRHGYSIDKSRQYRNNLMWQVGLLELSNAMDFPANVWNQIPTPLFAAILMGIGGSIALLWSTFPFWDMRRSLKNVKLLREERARLKSWRNLCTNEPNCYETRCMTQAWLDVNFRELGWETIDRILLDICCEISGILVGTGALMAIRGDIDAVYAASNLLSGYIGNSFLAPFALLTSFWAVFMWIRAGGEKELLAHSRHHLNSELQAKMRHHSRQHKLYAVVTGVTAVVGSVGSVVSSTMWQGYVVIAPCIFSSVFGNLLWRFRIGYSRPLIQSKQQLKSIDLLQTIQLIQLVQDEAERGTLDSLACFTNGEKLRHNILAFMVRIGLWAEFCCNIADQMPGKEPAMVMNMTCLECISVETISAVAKATMKAEKGHALAYHERHLVEVYVRYCRALEDAATPEEMRPCDE